MYQKPAPIHEVILDGKSVEIATAQPSPGTREHRNHFNEHCTDWRNGESQLYPGGVDPRAIQNSISRMNPY